MMVRSQRSVSLRLRDSAVCGGIRPDKHCETPTAR